MSYLYPNRINWDDEHGNMIYSIEIKANKVYYATMTINLIMSSRFYGRSLRRNRCNVILLIRWNNGQVLIMDDNCQSYN
jgi:hypothetical protein